MRLVSFARLFALTATAASIAFADDDLGRSQARGPERQAGEALAHGQARLPDETREALRAQLVLESKTAASRRRELEPFASEMAGHAVEVGCAVRDEDWLWHRFFVGMASGYAATAGRGTILWLGPRACRGALAVVHGDEEHPASRRALGVLVLTHEALHLRRHWTKALDEAEVECSAIRRFKRSVGELGGGGEAEELYPWALAIHWSLTRQSGEYWKRSCRLPSLM